MLGNEYILNSLISTFLAIESKDLNRKEINVEKKINSKGDDISGTEI